MRITIETNEVKRLFASDEKLFGVFKPLGGLA